MKIEIEPTGHFEKVSGVDCRIWKGSLDDGTIVEFFVPLVRAPHAAPDHPFYRQLHDVKAERQLVSFDTRLL